MFSFIHSIQQNPPPIPWVRDVEYFLLSIRSNALLLLYMCVYMWKT